MTMAWRSLQRGRCMMEGHMAEVQEELREGLGQEEAEMTDLGSEKNRGRNTGWSLVSGFDEQRCHSPRQGKLQGRDGLFWPY